MHHGYDVQAISTSMALGQLGQNITHESGSNIWLREGGQQLGAAFGAGQLARSTKHPIVRRVHVTKKVRSAGKAMYSFRVYCVRFLYSGLVFPEPGALFALPPRAYPPQGWSPSHGRSAGGRAGWQGGVGLGGRGSCGTIISYVDTGTNKGLSELKDKLGYHVKRQKA